MSIFKMMQHANRSYNRMQKRCKFRRICFEMKLDNQQVFYI